MDTQNPGSGTSGSQRSGAGSQGQQNSPLSNATYNMVQALHNLVDGLWHYDEYIQQEQDDDAKEMWRRFQQESRRQAEELRDHLSRRLQHETGQAGQAGHGPHASGGGSSR